MTGVQTCALPIYQRVDKDGVVEEKKWRIKDTDTKEFWLDIVTSKSFNDFVQNKYMIANAEIIRDEDIESEMKALQDEEDAD